MLHDDSLVQIEHLLLVRIAVGQGQFDVIKGENVEKCFKVFFCAARDEAGFRVCSIKLGHIYSLYRNLLLAS